jgi:hypothetical protein
MQRSSTKAAAEAQAAELKATAVLEANEAAQAAAEAQAATQDALEIVRRCSVADLDTPVAGEEIENGAEVPQNEGPDETGNELQPGDEITDPDPVEIPEEEMQVGDIQDESQDESQDEAMPEDPGAELSGKYDFSAKRLEEYLLLQNRRIK